MKLRLLLYIFLLPLTILAQGKKEKLKGTKIVELKNYPVESFSSLEIGDEFEVELLEKSLPSVSIDTDNNFHEFINVKVFNGKLEITTTKQFQKYKKLVVEIGVSDSLTNIFVKGKASITSKNKLNFRKLNIEAMEDSEVHLSVFTNNLDLYTKDKASLEIEGQAKSLAVNITDDSVMKVNFSAENTIVLQNSKSKLILAGKSDNSIVELKGDSYLDGSEYTSYKLEYSATDDAEAYINAADKVTLQVSGKTETYILNNPIIDLKSFKDGATIRKTDKSPSSLKSFLK